MISAKNLLILSKVAAGNEGTNACLSSPASAKNAITVGSTDSKDRVSEFSNTGSVFHSSIRFSNELIGRCLDMFAPGSEVTSLGINGSVKVKSGTSFSSPYVAGVLAQYWSCNPDLSPKDVTSMLKKSGTKGSVKGLGWFSFSPNLLVYSLPDQQ